MTDGVFVGGGEEHAEPRALLLRLANRHGLITGATGTGKTVTLQILAEGFSAAGVPVFVQDVKGDVSGLSRPGTPCHRLAERVATIGMSRAAPAPGATRRRAGRRAPNPRSAPSLPAPWSGS